jgi:hypothetical protein
VAGEAYNCKNPLKQHSRTKKPLLVAAHLVVVLQQIVALCSLLPNKLEERADGASCLLGPPSWQLYVCWA